MSLLKKIKKDIAAQRCYFDPDMYTNTVGSLVLTHYMLQQRTDKAKVRKTWKRLKKEGLRFWLDDPKFIERVLQRFDMEPSYGQFAMVISAFNVLFMPYVEEAVWPIREDGVYPQSIYHGKIYPIMTGLADVAQQEKQNIIEEV